MNGNQPRYSQPSQPAISVRQKKRPLHKRFRWYLLLVPLTLLVAMWFAEGLEPALSWNQFMNVIGIRNRELYTKLAVLCVLATALIAVVRILRSAGDSNDDD